MNNDLSHQLAEAFLRWPLPQSVCADPCATKQQEGRIGTNLLSYTETRRMIEDVVMPHIKMIEGNLKVANDAVRELQRENEKLRKDLNEQSDFSGNMLSQAAQQKQRADKAEEELATLKKKAGDLHAEYVNEVADNARLRDLQKTIAAQRVALLAALPALEEQAEDERDFWGQEDRNGTAKRAEQLAENVREMLK